MYYLKLDPLRVKGTQIQTRVSLAGDQALRTAFMLPTIRKFFNNLVNSLRMGKEGKELIRRKGEVSVEALHLLI